jgi:mono/diheme cytochrome c family protein
MTHGRKLVNLSGWVRIYLVLFLIETCLDALFTTDSLLARLGLSKWATGIAIVFVILGDLRVLLLLRVLRGGRLGVSGWSQVLGLSLLVPLLQAALVSLFPNWFSTPRHTFLVYELLFLGLLGGLALFRPVLGNPSLERFRRKILSYASLYYALWATSDLVILAGQDLGYLLRIIPNVLYYGGTVPFVYFTLKKEGLLHSVPPRARLPGRAPLTLLFVLLLEACGNQACPPPDGSIDQRTTGAKQRTASPPDADDPLVLNAAPVRLTRADGSSRTIRLAGLIRALGPARKIETEDPYYGTKKSFWGLPASDVLGWAFSETGIQSDAVEFIARDGYSVTIQLDQLERDGAMLVFADVEQGTLPPIGPRQANAGPLYLSWPGASHGNLTTHPRPFSVIELRQQRSGERLRFGPPGGFSADSQEARGEELFSERCVRCHALNQKGGRVGPDLNAPQNILSYRPEDQVRAYIEDPSSFRFTVMPSHEDLTSDQLDALISFLRSMQSYPMDLQKMTKTKEHRH